MNFFKYLKDKLYVLVLLLGVLGLLFLLFYSFKLSMGLIIFTFLVLIVFVILILGIDYYRKKFYYSNLLKNISELDKAYLVLETLNKPDFYEGKLLYSALYDINKSMGEYVNSLNLQMNDFKEYIEMWIHEIKIPIASLVLMAHNHKEFDKKQLEQIKKISDYVEQVLYYVRCENAEKDYLIKESSLERIISNVALNNKDEILENKIDFKVEDVNFKVYTDTKWLEFILNQIINNCIKYKRDNIDSYIKIKGIDKIACVELVILDNGIGIPEGDLKKVFEKSFTGYNGRIRNKSTGMGLFIARNLCNKLGHKIEIESQENEYTKIIITFFKNNFYEVTKM